MKLPTLKRPVVLAGLALLLVAAGFFGYDLWRAHQALPAGLIQVNGRIEGDRILVASRYPGRVAQLLAHEGDVVKAGQLLVKLDDSQARAQLRAARAAVTALQADVEAARRHAEQAQRDAERFHALRAEGTASIHEAEQAELGARVAQDQYAAAQAQLARARAGLSEAQTVLADLSVRAPEDGTITTRMADSGEVAAAGSVLFTLVNLDHLYLKVYVPEALIGKIRLGLPAKIYTDAFPNRPFDAELRTIASQAEFTPKEVQTADERVKLVYAVKLYLKENPEHRLTPGLPADAVIRWPEDAPWAPPRR